MRTSALGLLSPPLLVLAALLAVNPARAAQAELAGVWQGKLAVDPKTTLTIQFTFAKDAKGAYTAVLNSPDNPAIKNTAASGVSWDGSALKLQVPSLSGSYAGALKNGSLDGQWTQPGSTLPLVLAPYQKPVVTRQAAAQITGGWFGPLTVSPGTTVTAQFRFKSDDKGELQGTFSIPDQGLVDAAVSDIEFADGKLSLRIPQVRNTQYVATLANNQLTGNLKISGPGVPPDGLALNLKHGEYAPPVHALKLTSEQFAAVNGKWQGKLEVTPPNGQKVTLTMVLRFSTNANAQFVAFLDSPDQKAKDIAVTEATLTNGELALHVEAVRGDFKGKVEGNTMTGQWTQGPITSPLTLTRQ